MASKTLDSYPQCKQDEALKRMEIVHSFQEYCTLYSDKSIDDVVRIFLARYSKEHPKERLSRSTLYAWSKALREKGPVGLINQYGKAKKKADWPEEAKAYLEGLYLDRPPLEMSLCIEFLRGEAKNREWKLPSEATMRRHLLKIPQQEKDYHRKGPTYWRQHWVETVLRKYSSIEPGQIFVGDHVKLDFFARTPSGKLIRPWLTVWEDMRSRLIVGWCLTESPSTDSIKEALLNAVKDFTVPGCIHIDNGRDFASAEISGDAKGRNRWRGGKAIEYAGLADFLDYIVSFALIKNAKSKIVERFFGTFHKDFDCTFPTYVGRDNLFRPEGVDDIIKKGDEVPEWSTLHPLISDAMNHYNNSPHRGDGMDGSTPMQVWNAYYETHAVIKPKPSVLRLLAMKAVRAVKIRKYGIWAFKGFYRSDELMKHQGEWVMYKFDPSKIDELYVYHKDGSFLCNVERKDRTAMNDMEDYKKVKAAEKKLRKSNEDRAAARRVLVDVKRGYRVHDQESFEKPKAKIVMPLRTKLDNVEALIDRRESKETSESKPSRFEQRFAVEPKTSESDKKEQRKNRFSPELSYFSRRASS
jgi:putative transposase